LLRRIVRLQISSATLPTVFRQVTVYDITSVSTECHNDSQSTEYHRFMAPTTQLTIRLSPTQRGQLKRLNEKLGIKQAEIIRLAVARLAEAEGVLYASKKSGSNQTS
jgi:hypothetical protein